MRSSRSPESEPSERSATREENDSEEVALLAVVGERAIDGVGQATGKEH
jgi:hypothetical protein